MCHQERPESTIAPHIPRRGGCRHAADSGRGRLAPRDPGQGDCGKPSFDAGFDPASMRRRPQSCILSGLHNYEPMSRPLHWNVPAFDLLAPHVSPLRSLAKLPTVEGEAAAPPGMASSERFGPVRPWGAVGNGWARGLRLAARHAVAIAVKHLGSGACLGDTPSVSLLLARSTTGHADTSTAGLEVLEQFGRRDGGYLSSVRPCRKVLNGLTQRG